MVIFQSFFLIFGHTLVSFRVPKLKSKVTFWKEENDI